MNKISMVVTDLDGTLLTEKKEVTEKTRKAIHALKEHGILFGIASGRPVESTLLLSKDWGIEQDISFLIGMNGGTIYDCNTEQKEEYCLMAGETILEIIEHFKDMNVLLHILVGNHRYTNLSTPETIEHATLFGEIETQVDLNEFLKGKQINKLLLHLLDPNDMTEVKRRAATFSSPLYTSFQTAKNLYEYVNPNIHKGFGIEKVCKHFNIPAEEVVAFGDAQNDLELLEYAGTGVAVKNACDEIKAIANYVSEYTNEEDALGHYIDECILN